jgi:hypothetical protein
MRRRDPGRARHGREIWERQGGRAGTAARVRDARVDGSVAQEQFARQGKRSRCADEEPGRLPGSARPTSTTLTLPQPRPARRTDCACPVLAHTECLPLPVNVVASAVAVVVTAVDPVAVLAAVPARTRRRSGAFARSPGQQEQGVELLEHAGSPSPSLGVSSRTARSSRSRRSTSSRSPSRSTRSSTSSFPSSRVSRGGTRSGETRPTC